MSRLFVPFDQVEAFLSKVNCTVLRDVDLNLISGFVDSLSSLDRSIFYLYFCQRVSQKKIARLFSLSQGDISYRLNFRIPKSFKIFYEKSFVDLNLVFSFLPLDEFEREVISYVFMINNQVGASKYLGCSQSTLSKRIKKIRGKIASYQGPYSEGASRLSSLLSYSLRG